MSAPDTEIIIIGGGPVGATLAGLLGHRGIDCIVVDAREKNDIQMMEQDPRALALTHASRRILQSFNVWQKLPADRVGHFRQMHVWDENGVGEINFNCDEICESSLGYIIEQSVLTNTLNNVLDFIPSITCLYGKKPVAVHWTDSVITVDLDDKKITARLLVAADGIHSSTREHCSIGYTVYDYQQSALACLVRTERPHEDTARQRFLKDGPLAFLPMADPFQCGVVWSTVPDEAGFLMAMNDAEFNHALKTAFDNTLGDITDSSHRTVFPLQRAQAEHYCKDRIALIGDAAHSVHPLAGQGANLGLLDAASLAQVILEARRSNRDPGNIRVLRRYERWRKGENRFMMLVFEGFKYLFENQMTPIPFLRNMGLNFVDQKSYLKHLIMRRAMGLEGDLPYVAKA